MLLDWIHAGTGCSTAMLVSSPSSPALCDDQGYQPGAIRASEATTSVTQLWPKKSLLVSHRSCSVHCLQQA